MENPRAEKVALVEEVRTRLSSSSAAILTEYRGLNVAELAGLRRALREAGGQYKIYKNTLVRFAVRDLGLEPLEPLVEGPTAIAFVDGDAASVAKALRDFARTNPHLVVKGGLLGENVLSAADATALAELPSRDRMLAQVAGALAAPMQQLAGLLQALPQNLAYGVSALIEQRGGAPAEAGEPEPGEEAAPAADRPSDERAATADAAPSEPASETDSSAADEPQASAQEEPAATPSPPTSETSEAETSAETADETG
jgi:large subunit ribosomal protein L10